MPEAEAAAYLLSPAAAVFAFGADRGQTEAMATMTNDDAFLIEMHRKVAAYHADEAQRARLGVVKAYHAEIASVLSQEADLISARHAKREERKPMTLKDEASS